jgi:hypothetical protein
LLCAGKAPVSVTSSPISVRLGANPHIMNTLALVRNTVTRCSTSQIKYSSSFRLVQVLTRSTSVLLKIL